MSKRNHIVERASDVNGGQYIQTNPSYNSGYEDGKKAGKEYCASEITTLREQVEKLTESYDQCGRTVQEYGRTITQTELRLHEVATHCVNVEEQLAALSEQNEKMRSFLEFAWKDIPMSEYAFEILEHVMNLPNLATPALNRIRAEGMRRAAKFCVDNPMSDAHCLAEMLRAEADELEKQNG